MDIKAELKARMTKRTGNTETFAVQVTRYEGTDVVIGKRAGSDQELRIRLRADTDAARRRSISDFANLNPNNKKRVEPGGFLRVDSAYVDKDGDYQARWLYRIAGTPAEGRPIEGMIRVSPALPKGNGNGSYRMADVLTGEIHEPKTVAELKTAIAASAATPGQLAFVRMAIDGEQPKTWNIAGSGDKSYVHSTPYQKLMDLFQGVPDQMPVPDGIVIEVLPANRLFFGPEAAVHPHLDGFVEKSEVSGKEYSRGWTQGVLAVMRKPDGYEFVGDAVGTTYEPKFMRLGPPTESLSGATLAPAEQQLKREGPSAGVEEFDDLPDFDLAAMQTARVAPVPGTGRPRTAMGR